nr:hypothetical protein [Salmonid herpesvirus 1]
MDASDRRHDVRLTPMWQYTVMVFQNLVSEDVIHIDDFFRARDDPVCKAMREACAQLEQSGALDTIFPPAHTLQEWSILLERLPRILVEMTADGVMNWGRMVTIFSVAKIVHEGLQRATLDRPRRVRAKFQTVAGMVLGDFLAMNHSEFILGRTWGGFLIFQGVNKSTFEQTGRITWSNLCSFAFIGGVAVAAGVYLFSRSQ